MVVSALSSNFGLIGFTILQIERFSYFGILAWNCLFTPTFRGFWGCIFPQRASSIVVTPKRHILARKHVVWDMKRENRSNGSTWAQDREQDRTRQDRTGQSKKSQRLSSAWWKAPIEPIFTEICTVVAVPNVITCANFWTEIFRGYDFIRGRISHFPIDSCMGFTTVRR